ncbi:MAG: hypothetical protein PHE03_05250 [Bacteroidales bacterium]|nr:hypothetical protein [Bacteroidales bacterium]MDD3891692.1 hypothetical protein [Bacteroidales bacterium]
MMLKKTVFVLLTTSFIFTAISCQRTSETSQQNITKQQIAEDAIKNWMISGTDYPHYKPIVFGDLTPRYEKSASTLNLSILIAEEEDKSDKERNAPRLDSLKNELNKQKGYLLGYIIPHKFQEKNIAGETLSQELLFFLDTALRVASALSPESFDYILNEEVFFRLDSIFVEETIPLE